MSLSQTGSRGPYRYEELEAQTIEMVATITAAGSTDANVQGDFNLDVTGRDIDNDELAELVGYHRSASVEVIDQGDPENNPGKIQALFSVARDEEFVNELFQSSPGEGELVESGQAGTSGGSGTSDPGESSVSTRNGRLDQYDVVGIQKHTDYEDSTNGTGGAGSTAYAERTFSFHEDLGLSRGPIHQEGDTLDGRVQFFRDGVNNQARAVYRATYYWKVHEGEVNIHFHGDD